MLKPTDIMFIFVTFDLPTQTAQDRHAYTKFRKALQYAGFQLLQYSVYQRHCYSHEIAERHKRTIAKLAPDRCHICILTVTEIQMMGMVTIRKNYQPLRKKPKAPEQLTLF